MAVSHLRNTPITGKSYTTPADATVWRPASHGVLSHIEQQLTTLYVAW
jgi:hypothetical protein